MAGETLLNGRYALIAQQGSGGMSVIYQAIDRALGRTVAVKILRPSLTTDPSFLEKFRNEARSVANLSHPNIVTVHDVGSDGATHFIVMELVDGKDLKKIIKEVGALPIDRALDLGIQMCAGIGYAHRSGLVHADVKPQNMLVTQQDVVKVTDFGIAQAATDTQPVQRAEVVWGSPHYFAPEQARGERPTPASDVYSIGIVMFEMLTGRLPYAGADQQALAMAHIQEPVPKVSDYNAAVPESLSRIIYKVMSKDASGRYREADQLGNVLKNFRDKARGSTAVQPGVPGNSTSPQRDRSASGPQSPAPAQPQPPVSIPMPPRNNEVTAKYGAAPNAPQPYDPRHPNQGASIPAPNHPATAGPQPFQQNYMPPPMQPQPQPVPQSIPQANMADSRPYVAPAQQYSQPYVPAEEGTDYVTIALAFLAFVAVAGLIPLWVIVLASR